MKKEIKIILPSFLLLIFTCVITLVYASFNTSMTIDGVATILSSSVEIKGTTYDSATGGASYQTPSYTKNTVTYPVSMPAGSSITFDLSVTNGTTANYEITNLVHSQTNLTINYSGQGCFLADTLNSKSTYNCNITITNETGSSINDTVITTYTYQEKNDYSLKHRMEVLAYGIDQNIVTDMADDRLESNGTITYIGSNPDNYVLLEGSLWRIVNSDDSVTNSEGKAVGGIKLVRRDSLGKYVWRYTESGVNNGYGVADWSSSTLKAELNDLFYTSSSGTCYMTDGSASTSSCDFSSNGLNRNKLIENVTWNTGAGNPNSNASTLLRELKSNSKVSDNGCTTSAKSNSKCNTSPNGGFTSSSTGYVGLLSPSDFMYATAGGNTTSRASCLEMSGSSWNNYEDCYTTWLKTTAGTDWTLQPAIYSNDYSRVFVYNKTYVNNQSSKKAYIVRPSIYIKDNTILYSGKGTQTDPYIIDEGDVVGLYSVTFNANGGTGSMSTEVFEEGVSRALTTNTFEKTGYTFYGWSLTEDGSVLYEDGESITVSSSMTLYAVWAQDTTLYDKVESLTKGVLNTNFANGSDGTNNNNVYTYSGVNSDGGSENIYYYRGLVDNNVYFANLCWKIIRTTSTGGVKLIYNGTKTNDLCSGNTTNMTTTFNSLDNSPEGAGYMYTSGVQHGTDNSSEARTAVYDFYRTYLSETGYTSYLEDTVFCNDRTVPSGTYSSTASFSFNRSSLGTPTLECPNNLDRFSVSSSIGNGVLTLPIGLITADEAVLAGAANSNGPYNHYLKTSYQTWTMTPRQYDYSNVESSVKMWRLNTDGTIGTTVSDYQPGRYIRPVISINSGVLLSGGTGTESDPYTLAPPRHPKYALSYHPNGGVGTMEYALIPVGEEYTLNANAFTRSGYHFVGWATTPTGDVMYEDREIVILPRDTVLYAVWEVDKATFDYTGTIQSYLIAESGFYSIEAWGAQGGSLNSTYVGGYGAHTFGVTYIDKGITLYIQVGGQGGTPTTGVTGLIPGGYNGGGYAYRKHSGVFAAGGGGATSVALASGQLSSIPINNVITIAAGGAGAYGYNDGTEYNWSGNSGGGIEGGYTSDRSYAGNQSSGFAYGTGGQLSSFVGDGNTPNQAGGGGGYYGGKSFYDGAAGGGSSYINTNILRAYNNLLYPRMIAYKADSNTRNTSYYMSTSDDSSTYTLIGKGASSTATREMAKEGNGYVIIEYIGQQVNQ